MKNFNLNTYSKSLLQIAADGTSDPRVLQILKKYQKLFLCLGLQQGGHQDEQDVFNLAYLSFFDASEDWNPIEGTFEAWVVGKFCNEMKRMTANLAACGHGTIELNAPIEYASASDDAEAEAAVMHDRSQTAGETIKEEDRFDVVDNMADETLDAFVQPSTISLISLISAGQSLPQSALKMGKNVRTVQREFKKMCETALSIRIASMKLAGLNDSLILNAIQNVEKPDVEKPDRAPPSYRKQLGLAPDLMASKQPAVKPVAEVNQVVPTVRMVTNLQFVKNVAPQWVFDFGGSI